jgi:serine/threonine protein kinase
VLALEPGDPRRIGPYRLLARIGSGGMGTVYFARSPGGRAVAVKRVHAELAEDTAFRERFRREAAAARAVGGAFTAAVLDADLDAEIPWLVSEFLPGVPLDDAVRMAGPLTPAAARTLAAGVAEALRAIHAAGIVHRDLKPANVLLTPDGPRVLDFGIARALDAATLTRPGEHAGSPGFMSPEQVAGTPVGPAADVFSFGATLAFACTGAEPFGDGPWEATMFRIESEAPRLDGIVDAGLRDLIASCMARDPADRPSAAELTERLSVQSPEGTPWPQEDGSWLPSPVLEEISRRTNEAENPPAAAKRRRPVPLALAAGAAVLALAAGGLIVAWPSSGGSAPGATATPTPAPRTSQPSPSPTRQLEFYFTGNVKLTYVKYTVNGHTTTVKNAKLPWRAVVRIPALPQRTKWRMAFKFPPGEIRYRVLVDGFPVRTGNYAAAGVSGSGKADGTH